MTTRDYVGSGITVHWDSDRCIHSEHCTSGAPTVFDKAARPWVNLEGADPSEVARVVDTCPSGALSYTRTDGVANGTGGRSADVAVAVTITPQKNGPLSVKGPVGLTQPDGTVLIVEQVTLCRCGQSASKPRCDGSHMRVGFTAPGVSPK